MGRGKDAVGIELQVVEVFIGNGFRGLGTQRRSICWLGTTTQRWYIWERHKKFKAADSKIVL